MSAAAAEGSSLADRARAGVQTLSPGYFALVMATGIISVGLELEGFAGLSAALLAVCVVAFVVLLGLTAWRLVSFRADVRADFVDPRRAFSWFTYVAGTDVLGVRLGAGGWHGAAGALLAVAALGWLVLGYVVPWTAVLGHAERPLVRTADGTWFTWVVASESVAVAAASLEPFVTVGRDELALLALVSWSVGVFLYGAVAVLVMLRLMTYPVAPEDLTPPYWVTMGAIAISVLAGARIVEMADAPVVAATRGLVAGLAVLLWAVATWLFPALVAAGFWRHVVRRVPLAYTPTLWSMVFPLGMYAVAGIYLGDADSLPLVSAVGSAELWLALAAWVVVAAAMTLGLLHTLAGDPTGRRERAA